MMQWSKNEVTKWKDSVLAYVEKKPLLCEFALHCPICEITYCFTKEEYWDISYNWIQEKQYIIYLTIEDFQETFNEETQEYEEDKIKNLISKHFHVNFLRDRIEWQFRRSFYKQYNRCYVPCRGIQNVSNDNEPEY